ncbi:YfhO family protein [Candidatus Gottesmanbacteria bacterium]|nr:YfhO family protein [Candidatus Gottesmanbacteria bacterium]
MTKIKLLYKILPIFFIASIVIALFGKSLIPAKGYILYGGDLNDQFYYWKSYYVQNLKQGIFPFWNPYSFSGTPFLAHPSTSAFYPFNIIFFILPFNTTFSVYLFIHIVMAGTFMYLLCKKYADTLSSLAGAITFSLSGLMAARIYSGHIDIISTLVWIPAVFWAMTNTLDSKNKKYVLLSILFLTLQILAGYQAVVIFTLEFIFIYQSVSAIFDYYKKISLSTITKKFLKTIFIVLISYGISAIQLLPTMEFVRSSIRGQGLPYEMLAWGSYTKDLFGTFINPFIYGNPFPQNYTYNGPGPNFFELSYFAGVIPLFIFLLFIIYHLYYFIRKRKVKKIFLALILPVLFFSLTAMGNNFPIHKFLYQMFPPYRLFRFPSQHLMMVVFIISLTTGIFLGIFKNKLMKLVILLLITLELFIYDKQFITTSKIPTDNFDQNLTSILEKDTQLIRLLPDYSVVSQVRKDWDFESSMYYKIQSTSGYNPILLNSYYHFIDLINKKNTSSVAQFNVEIPPPDPASKDIDFLNIKYVLTNKNYDMIYGKSLSKYALKLEGNNYRLYENKDFLPRFFLDCSGRDAKDVEVVDYQINNIKLKTSSNCDGILSSSEVYYPGWKATIDNNETPIYKSNTAFRSIFLPKGEHDVIFYYQPTIYYLGGFITLLTLVSLFIIIRKYYE